MGTIQSEVKQKTEPENSHVPVKRGKIDESGKVVCAFHSPVILDVRLQNIMKKIITIIVTAIWLSSTGFADIEPFSIALFEDKQVEQFQAELIAGAISIKTNASPAYDRSALVDLKRDKRTARKQQKIEPKKIQWVETSPDGKLICAILEDENGSRSIAKVLSAQSKQVVKDFNVGHIEDFLWSSDSKSIVFLEHDCRISKRHFIHKWIGHPKFKCTFYISILDLNSGQVLRKQIGKEMTDAQGIIFKSK